MTFKALPTIELSETGPVGSLTLNRPDRMNACNHQMLLDLKEAANWFNEREHIKVVILSGKGKSFCTGFDLASFSDLTPLQVRDSVAAGWRMASALSQMRAITIAAVHKYCVGGGFVIAAACDFRYAEEGTQFWLPETQLGVPLAWGGMPWLVREAGPLKAMEFTLLCERWDAAGMCEMGLLNEVVGQGEVLSRANEVATTLSQRSSLVLETTKMQVSAAKAQLANADYGFMDAHVFLSAVMDDESVRSREAHLTRSAAQARPQ